MGSAPALSPTSMGLMRKVFALLEENFDAEQGRYVKGYSDERIHKETGASLDAVKKFRVDGGFGKITPPDEFQKLASEMEELQGLFVQSEAALKEKIADMSARLRQLERRFD